MKAKESYVALSGYFDYWVRFMEIRTRLMEVEDSNLHDLRIAVISPPTDRGIKILTQANAKGETHLVCFSKELGAIAKDYSIKHQLTNLKICVEPFFALPFEDGYFDAVFANCFFDFCEKSDFNSILKEIKRSLKSNGLFFSVYMDIPEYLIGRIWGTVFRRLGSLSKGCHPIDIIPSLADSNFKLKKNLSIKRFGFPMKYVMAER